MHPLFLPASRLLIYTLLWCVVGAGIASYAALVLSISWQNALVISLPTLVLLGFILTSAFYVVRSLQFSQQPIEKKAGVWLSAAVSASVVWTAIVWLWNSFSQSINLTLSIQFSVAQYQLVFLFSTVLYFGALLSYELYFTAVRAQNAQQKESEARLLARDAELQTLRNQINPHFLFNSLNSISALISQDATGARAMTIELAQFFRKTLSLSTEQTISLEQEVELCQHYLSIEKIRFGEKLQTLFDIDPELLTQKIPPFLLQPLIENAVKHGMSQLTEPGQLRVEIHQLNPWWSICITNPIADSVSSTATVSSTAAVTSPSVGTGLGLKNLHARIEHFFGKKARVKCERTARSFFVEIILPLRREF